jgi:hypothetical protein
VQQWWVNGVRHREDGPAVVEDHEMQQWWVQGLLHREDGPAVEYADGSLEWHLMGVSVDESIVQDSKKSAEFMKNLGGSD